ncbi:hypothetical protein [Catellatospora tritici]|uniref:hypothetical protein n=1 Tax=Catellatospora tritici TaxID=2851566 RepID=UPI001C2CCC88|nr:hypothetical protein [Catellatospora tritici]MBV1848512.1 hypothetical protein [Catellatospora tritici]MBV1851468.1 hypothetical protein [Catellatospora tritici]
MSQPPTPEYPPPYPTQPQYPTQPIAPPKKSKAGLIIGIVVVVLLLCIGGVVGVFFLAKDKVEDAVQDVNDAVASAQAQLPTKKTTVVAPDKLGGRAPVEQAELKSLSETMKSGLSSAVPGASNVVAGFYGDPAKQDMVMLFAAAAKMGNPEKELDEAFKGMGTSGLTATDLASVDPGPLGGSAKCGSATTAGVDLAVCAWADNGSLGMFVWYFKSVDDIKTEFVTLRGQVEQQS